MQLSRQAIQRMVGAQPGGTVISGGGSSGGGGGTGSGTVTSVAMSVPTGFQISGTPITSAGTLALTFISGYALPTTADVSKGVTAYGWGNHADAGYLTSSSLNGYATQQWVGQQGFLTSSDLSGYATQSWVQQQGFATTSQLSHYLALTGGTMENSIVTPGSDSYGIYPETDRYGFIGKSTNWYWNIYGSRLYAEKMELYVYSSGSRSLYGGVDNNNFYLYPGTNSYKFNVDSNGYLTAQKFVKDGGTSSQFLKADGSVDANTYLTSSSLTNYVQKSQTAGLLKNDGTVDTSTYLTSVPSNYLSVDNNGMLNHQIQTNDQLILYGTGNNFGELVISDAALYDVHYLSANANGKMTWDGNVLAYSSEIPVGHSVYGGLTSGYANVGNDDYVRWDMPFTFDPSDGGTVIPAFLPLSGGTVTGNLTVTGNITANQSTAKTQSVLNSDATNGVYMYWDNSGYFYFHGDTAAPREYVFDANVHSSSDARLKNIVSHAGLEVDKLATLPLVWFTWKKDERRRMHFGTIAQEWQKVLPEVVSENGDGMLAMDYGAAAMAAGVTACREIVRLKAEIERLKKRLN